jgi:hypothetical protein
VWEVMMEKSDPLTETEEEAEGRGKEDGSQRHGQWSPSIFAAWKGSFSFGWRQYRTLF